MTLRPVSGLRDLVSDYDGFILDLWGVVHDGVNPYPGVLDCMARLVEAEKRVILLSNAPRRADDVVRRIAAIGVPAGLYHGVMSSGEEAWQHLKRRDDPFYAALGRACLHICSERDLEIREGLDLTYVDDPTRAEFILNTGPGRLGRHDRGLRADPGRFARARSQDGLRQPGFDRDARRQAGALRRGAGGALRGDRRHGALARQAAPLGL